MTWKSFGMIVGLTGIATACSNPVGSIINDPKPVPPPVVTSVSPSSGTIRGGTLVVITGTGFQSGAVASLDSDACLSLVYISSTSLQCTSPAHSAASIRVKVTNPDGQFGALNSAYAYLDFAPPAPGSAIAVGAGFASGTGVGMRATAGEAAQGVLVRATGVSLVGGANGISFSP